MQSSKIAHKVAPKESVIGNGGYSFCILNYLRDVAMQVCLCKHPYVDIVMRDAATTAIVCISQHSNPIICHSGGTSILITALTRLVSSLNLHIPTCACAILPVEVSATLILICACRHKADVCGDVYLGVGAC